MQNRPSYSIFRLENGNIIIIALFRVVYLSNFTRVLYHFFVVGKSNRKSGSPVISHNTCVVYARTNASAL